MDLKQISLFGDGHWGVQWPAGAGPGSSRRFERERERIGNSAMCLLWRVFQRLVRRFVSPWPVMLAVFVDRVWASKAIARIFGVEG